MKKLLQFPLTRLVLGCLLVGVPYFAVGIASMSFLRRLAQQDIGLLVSPLVFLAVTVLALAAYWLYWRWVERRPMTEFAPAGAGRAIRMGAGVTLLMATGIFGFLWLHGNLLITAGGGWRYVPQAAALALVAAVPEEILCRGLLFRLTEEKLGSAVAVLVSSGLFGLGHYGHPGVTLLNALGLGLEAGLPLAAAYMLTRTLWAPIAAHFTWDFIAGVLGLPGGPPGYSGYFTSRLSGNPLLTGSEPGTESALYMGVGIVVGTFLLWVAYRRGAFIRPFWARTERVQSGAPVGA